MQFIAQSPAETTIYFVAGYSVIFGVMFLYVLSLAFRWRKLIHDLKFLEDLDRFDDLIVDH
jgi:hypothetical protein